ncbi:MAG: hypothetical protein JXJ20_02840 [Anaerolineae bacterium]|jgi:capsular polysaccharide biosynthesis protein|nr:hypothetical protein [Anaerolineae bacterium]
MAKKRRKPNVPQQTLERARRELYSAADAPVEQAPRPASQPQVAKAPTPVQAVKATSVRNLRQEYAYVLSDLRNMGILAAVLMVVLVLMSLFI